MLIQCPWHDSTGETPSYAVYPDGCFCFNPSCGARETPEQFLDRIGADGSKLPAAPPKPIKEHQPAEQLEFRYGIWHRTLMEGARKDRQDWFYERGLWESTLRRFRLGHTGDRFAIPIVAPDGTRSYQLRSDPLYCYDDEPKYKNPHSPTVAFRPSPGSGPTVICEGPLDAILLAQYGYDAITTTGGAGSLSREIPSAVAKLGRRVLVATDLDEAGGKAAQQLLEVYPRATRVTWDGGKDITEALMQIPPIRRGSWLRDTLGV